jgi:ACS family glucarate transporter-like MFS transporter
MAAVASASIPSGHATVAILSIVFGARILLGVAQAALFPVASGFIETWFPVRDWNLANGVQVTALWLGAACTPPLVAALMTYWGWRAALLAVSVPAAILVVIWMRMARDRPQEHPSVSAEELAELAGNPPPVDSRIGIAEVLALLRNRNVALLTISYFLTNYVFYLVSFWCFIYLVQERHFTVLDGGLVASLPFLSAAIAAGVGGRLADRLCLRFGLRKGMRIVPLAALPASALFLVLTGAVPGAGLAVACLCLAFACTELVEGPFWGGTMRAAPTEVMAATALLNTGGNLGGVVATPMIAWLSGQHAWSAIFALGAVLSMMAAGLWAFVDLERKTEPSR